MKFKSIIKKLILEDSRFKILHDKMVLPSEKALEKNPKAKGIMSFDILKQIIFADPDTKAPENFDVEGATIADMDNVKVGKYVQWMLKHFAVPVLTDAEKNLDPKSPEYKAAIKRYKELYLEDLFKMTEQLQFFDRYKQYLEPNQKDINKLTPRELADIFANFKLPEKKQKELDKKAAKKTREGLKHAGGKIIYEGNDWVVIMIEDKGTVGKDAAIYYGGFKDWREGESNWCTSAPGLNWFNNYIKDGPLYVIFPQDDKGEVGKRTGLPKERYQFHFQSKQFMNRDDHQIDLPDFFSKKAPELKELFKSHFAKNLSVGNEQQLEVIYPGSNPAVTYVAIYGFDELFENVPDTITTLKLINKGKTSDGFDIPQSLGRFTNLENLAIENFAKSLPNVFDKMSKLSFISLPNNSLLKELPSSMGSLDSLTFINLSGTNPNLIIPEDLKERMSDQGDSFYFVQ